MKKQKGFIKSIEACIASIACIANDKKGATLIEMALYIALVVIVCIAVVLLFILLFMLLFIDKK